MNLFDLFNERTVETESRVAVLKIFVNNLKSTTVKVDHGYSMVGLLIRNKQFL